MKNSNMLPIVQKKVYNDAEKYLITCKFGGVEVYIRKKLILMTILSVVILGAVSVFASGEQAQDITSSCVITASQNQNATVNMLDKKYNTLWTSKGEAQISFSSKTPIGSIYIIWNEPPGENFYIENGGGKVVGRGGHDGFLHEFIPLYDQSENIVVKLSGEKSSIEKIYVFSPGEVPQWVQKWNKPYKKADMLLVSTHADDEHLWFGGAMPVYAGEQGKKVQVIYLMKHVVQRNHELLDGLWTVGIRAYPVIAPFPDKYVGNLNQAKQVYNYEEVRRFQVEMIRKFKPDVILGHDLNGEYGHGAHIMNAHSLLEAAQNSGDAEYFPQSAAEYGVWRVKKCYLHLYDMNGTKEAIMNWEQPLSKFGGKTGFQMAVEGFACHESQKGYFSVANTGEKYDCHRFGLAYTSVGDDVSKNDFFENIKPEELKPKPQPENPAPKPEPDIQNGENHFILILIVTAISLTAIAVLIIFFRRKK